MAEVFTNLVAPLAGTILSNVLYIAPLPEVLRARRKDDIGALNPVVFAMIFSTSLGFFMYGLLIDDLYLVFANCFGFMWATFYFTTGLKLTKSKNQARILEFELLGVITFWGSVMLLGHLVPGMPTAKIVGIFSTVSAILMFASPLTTIALVVKTKNSASIERFFMCATIINCFMWGVYGFFIMDLNVLMPNFGGLTLGSIQLFLCLKYPRNHQLETSMAATIPGTLPNAGQAVMLIQPESFTSLQQQDHAVQPVIFMQQSGSIETGLVKADSMQHLEKV